MDCIPFEIDNYSAVNKALTRLVQNNTIQRIRKGLYYVPKISIVTNMPTRPIKSDIVDYYKNIFNDNIYLTGVALYHSFGLTDQVPAVSEYATYNPPKKFEEYGIYFLKAKYFINNRNKKLLQILDCIENIENIPNQSPNIALHLLVENQIKKIDKFELKELIKISSFYSLHTKKTLQYIFKKHKYE
jgi:hypothetical protein